MSLRSALPEVLAEGTSCLEEAAALPWWKRPSQIAPKDMFVGAFSFGIIVAVLQFSASAVPKCRCTPSCFYSSHLSDGDDLPFFFIGWMLKKRLCVSAAFAWRGSCSR